MSDKPRQNPDLTPSVRKKLGMDADAIKKSFGIHMEYSLAKDEYTATPYDCYSSLALSTRDRLMERWINTQQTYYNRRAKRVYYLSLEFLIGRTLGNSLVNLGLRDEAERAMRELGYSLEELREKEWDAGLGNGGLGRLAACFMDSLATLEYPAMGYGIRYDYGIFSRVSATAGRSRPRTIGFASGTSGNSRARSLPTSCGSTAALSREATGRAPSAAAGWTRRRSSPSRTTPQSGYRNNTVNNLRLWSAKSTREFDLNYFNDGDYIKAVAAKSVSENITKVLYPNDNVFEGKELRLKQEYFFVSATIQDIVRRYKKTEGSDFRAFPDQVAIQLNDTHRRSRSPS
jgi:starch phosphorylase